MHGHYTDQRTKEMEKWQIPRFQACRRGKIRALMETGGRMVEGSGIEQQRSKGRKEVAAIEWPSRF